MINAFLLTVCFTVSARAVPTTTGPPPSNCSFGPTIGQELDQINRMSAGKLYIRCNHTCSQVVCSGRLDISVVKLPFCFSLSLNHCDNPASVGYNLQIPDRNVSLKGKLTHSISQTIPGPNTPLGNLSFLIFTRVEHVNATTIRFGINSSVKETNHGYGYFLGQFTLLPVQYIVVTPCSQAASSLSPPPLSQQCSTTLPVTNPTVTPKVIPKSKTYGKTCEVGMIYGQCGQYEMCVYNTCRCSSDATLNPTTGLCTPDFTTSSTKSTAAPSIATKSVTQANTDKKKSGSKNIVVIACSVVGGVLLVAVVVGTIVCIRRRRQNSVYRDRLQLLTDDDEDDDTNAVI